MSSFLRDQTRKKGSVLKSERNIESEVVKLAVTRNGLQSFSNMTIKSQIFTLIFYDFVKG